MPKSLILDQIKINTSWIVPWRFNTKLNMPGKPNHTHTKYYLDLFFTWRLSVWTKAARSASYFCRYYWWNKSEIWLAEYKGNTKLISSTWNKSDSQDALLEILLLFQHVWSIKPNLIHNKCTSQFLLLDDYLEAKKWARSF